MRNDFPNRPQQTQQEPLVCVSGWLIRHHDPINFPPYDIHAHTHMLTHSLMLGKGDSCCQSLLGKEGGPRDMGRLWTRHINNSQVGWSRAINVASHCWPSEPRNPGVMGSSWTKVSGRTAEKAEVTVGSTRRYQPPESQTCCLPTRNTLQLVYLKRKTRQEIDYFELKSLGLRAEIGLQVYSPPKRPQTAFQIWGF